MRRRAFAASLGAVLFGAPLLARAERPNLQLASARTGADYSGYDAWTIAGADVFVSAELKSGDARALERCLAVLSHSLFMLGDRLPPAAWARLQPVPIWLENEDKLFPGGCYHESRSWLIQAGRDPVKAKSVQFSKNLASLIAWQPMVVLHELAHAYHDQVLTYDYMPLHRAYQRARDSGRYDRVLRNDFTVGRAYAMVNHKEFFAELTESYFGQNDYYPYTREQMRDFDPDSLHVIAEAWRQA